MDAVIIEPNGGAVHIDETRFENNEDHGVFTYGPGSEFVIESSVFTDNEGGVSAINNLSLHISDCRFENHVVAIQYDHCQGTIRDCRFSGGVNADVASTGSHLSIDGCRFSSAYSAIVAWTWGRLSGRGNIIPAGEGERIFVAGTACHFNDNHIIRGDGPCVKIGRGIDPPSDALDFTNNYWGTAEWDSIAAWIWDANDDFEIHGYVNFQPFSPDPLPSDRKSMGDIKRMFR